MPCGGVSLGYNRHSLGATTDGPLLQARRVARSEDMPFLTSLWNRGVIPSYSGVDPPISKGQPLFTRKRG